MFDPSKPGEDRDAPTVTVCSTAPFALNFRSVPGFWSVTQMFAPS